MTSVELAAITLLTAGTSTLLAAFGYSDFSSASLDVSRFQIPAGFKATADLASLALQPAKQPRNPPGRRTAKLSFRLVVDCTAKGASKPMQLKGDRICLAQQAVVDESDVQSAQAGDLNPEFGADLEIVLTDKAAARMREITDRNIGNKMGVVLNDRLVMAPSIQSHISGNVRIAGLTPQEVEDFVRALHGNTRGH